MRIISGQWRGMRLEAGQHENLRPLTDRIKESVFGIIDDFVEDAQVLDLFAGSGSFGIEALSRGAASVIFCEKDSQATSVIRKNLEKIRCETHRFEIVRADVFKCIRNLFQRNIQFDLIFLDPPFRTPVSQKIFASLSDFDVLRRKGIMIFRHHKKETVLEKMTNFDLFRSKQYGDSMVRFYKKTEEDENSDLSRNV
jgi:16S rRNA (guanine966-N2)-methyltransferase